MIECQEYSRVDNRIKILNKENGGVSSARNPGLENAGGDLIVFVDRDDYIDSEFLGVLLEGI